jgi:hypothetical protein
MPDTERATRLQNVRQNDAIWALEGFDKDAVMAVLDDAYAAGRITPAQQVAIVTLHNKLVGAEATLAQLDAQDPKRAAIVARMQDETTQLRAMAETVGPELIAALDLV